MKFRTDTSVADFRRDYETRLADFARTVNTAKAESDLAYQLQQSKEQQTIVKGYKFVHHFFLI